MFNKDVKKTNAVVRITRVAWGPIGAHITVSFPVNLNTVSKIEQRLRGQGLNIHSQGGNGDGHSCLMDYGPFKSPEEASSQVERMAAEVRVVYDEEQNILKEFAALIDKTYPI